MRTIQKNEDNEENDNSEDYKDNEDNDHTSYLSFILHRQDFRIPNFYTQKLRKTPKNYNKYPRKEYNMQFFAFNLENFTPDRFFYTGTARGARDKYEV